MVVECGTYTAKGREPLRVIRHAEDFVLVAKGERMPDYTSLEALEELLREQGYQAKPGMAQA